MESTEKFARMLEILQSSREEARRLLSDPEGFLGDVGLSADELNRGRNAAALNRGKRLLRATNVERSEDVLEALKKLGETAHKSLGDRFHLEVQPFGFRLLEIPKPSDRLTATGSVKCTWDPWDGCSADPDE